MMARMKKCLRDSKIKQRKLPLQNKMKTRIFRRGITRFVPMQPFFSMLSAFQCPLAIIQELVWSSIYWLIPSRHKDVTKTSEKRLNFGLKDVLDLSEMEVATFFFQDVAKTSSRKHC